VRLHQGRRFSIDLELRWPCDQRPEPGVGASVDPLGDGLIRLLPDGFARLFAPAAAPPAL
jgi:hypothetical protein